MILFSLLFLSLPLFFLSLPPPFFSKLIFWITNGGNENHTKEVKDGSFFSRLVITYYFDQEIVVYANCAVHYFCQWEQWYWKFIYVLLSNVCFPGMCCSVFCRQFYWSCFFFYIDVIMLVQIFSILLILFTWNQFKICFKV